MENKNNNRRSFKYVLRHLYQNRFQSRQKGSLLIGLIITMVIFSILGGAMVYTFSSSAMDAVFGNYAQRAYYAAESGARYMMAQYRHASSMTKAQFVALSGTVTLPNNSGQATITITDSMNGATTDLTTTAAETKNLGVGDNLLVTDAANFPQKSGFFRIGSTLLRYKSRLGNQLQVVTGQGSAGISVTTGDTVTAPMNQVSITSKGSYPLAGIFNMSRTVEYGWILSGTGSGGPGGGSNDPMNDLTNWTSTAPGNSWGSFGIAPIDGDNALRVTGTTGGEARAILGYATPYFYNQWVSQGNFLSYDIQVKMKTWNATSSTYLDTFMGGLSFRLSHAGANYDALGASLLKGVDIFSTGSIPNSSATYIALWKDINGQQRDLLAYKELTTASGVVVGATPVFEDDMESGETKWNSTHPGWSLVDTDSASPTHSWKGVLSSSTAKLTFWHNFNRNGTNSDNGYVEMSSDNGANWTEIAHYTSDNSGPQSIDIPATSTFLLKPNVIVRFRLRSTTNHSQPVWNVDDVDIKVNGVSMTPFPDDMESGESKWNSTHTGWSQVERRYNSYNHSWEGVLLDQHSPPDRMLTSVPFSLAGFTAPVTTGSLTSLTPFSLPGSATLTFNHKLDWTTGSTVRVQMCQGTSCPTTGTWTNIQSFTNSVNSWTQVTIPITDDHFLLHSNVYVRFYLTSSTAPFPTWYIDDVKISSSRLADWPTILVRINEKTLTSTDASTKFHAGDRVNDIKIYYASTSANGTTPYDTPLDNNRSLGNPRGSANWPPTDANDTNSSNDRFTLVAWDWVKTDTHVERLGTGKELNAIIRTDNNLTTTFASDRPEVAVHAFGDEAADNIYFDDFGINVVGGSGTPYIPPIQQ